jgi:selenocysteine lyase/cysteine desulfurase
MSRSGIHCAPSAHKTIGTYPMGTVRFSFSYFNTQEQVAKAVEALVKTSKRRK